MATISAPGGWVGSETITFRATDPGGLYSTDSATFTVVDGTPPNTTITWPSNEYNATSMSVSPSWTGSDNITPTGSSLYSYHLDSQSWSGFSSSTGTSYSGLSYGYHYFYVKAKDLAGLEDPSPDTRSVHALQSPTLSATAGRLSVALSWTGSTGATTYKVKYWRQNPYQETNLDVGNVLNRTITGLTAGVTYYFRVGAYCSHAFTSWSTTVSATPTGCF